MRKSFVIYLVLCTSLYAKAQYVAVDTTKLAQAYATWQQESSPANQRVFFDAFPKNWMEFIATYQYGAPFYDRANKHVHALGEMAKAIPTDEYCERLVNLCIGGELDADAPNYLRELVGEALSADGESRKGIFTCYPDCVSGIVFSSGSFTGRTSSVHGHWKRSSPICMRMRRRRIPQKPLSWLMRISMRITA